LQILKRLEEVVILFDITFFTRNRPTLKLEGISCISTKRRKACCEITAGLARILSRQVLMTQKKPPGVKWEEWTEGQIRNAQEEGQFDDLPNAGRPLPDLEKGYDPLWWVKNLIQRENISSLPPSLEIKRKVQRELETIWQLRREEDVRAKVRALNAEISRINRTAISGPPTTQTLLDLEAIVQQWREQNQQS
jgi:Domain of unknown function (DUF1992)